MRLTVTRDDAGRPRPDVLRPREGGSIGLRNAQDWGPPPPGPDFRGAGDHAFAHAIAHPEAPVRLTDSFAQVALVNLKLAAIAALPVGSVRSFLGLGHFGRRVWFYHELRPRLVDDERAFWDAREPAIRAGLLGEGDVERAMARFRRRLLPLCHGSATVEALLDQPTLEAQREWLARRWLTAPWRALRRVSPEARAVDALLQTTLARTSPELQWRLLGRYLDLEAGPAWLTTAGHRALRG